MNRRRRGFALIESLIAVVIIGVALLMLLQVRNQAMQQFIELGDQYTGSWLAELKMAELISENLPDPEEDAEDTWFLSGSGDFSEFNARLNDLNYGRNEYWVERDTFSRFEFSWTKELIFVGREFIGTREELDAWEQPEDERGDLMPGIVDPRTKPAARLVRVILKVYLPLPRTTSEEGEEESDLDLERRRTITLVTYVDPATLNTAEIESVDAPPETPPANPPPATPPPGGN